MAVPGGTKEMLADIPRHVWKGFPDSMRLSPSVVDPSRIGELKMSCFGFVLTSHHFSVL